MVTQPNYEIRRVLGSGSFGYVFEAYDHTNNQLVALKRIEKVGKSQSREYEILFDVKNCDHVVKILDFYYSKNDQAKQIQNIVFEYMEDNLENMIQTRLKKGLYFSQWEVKFYIFQLQKGLEYIHAKNITHRDLKPENILVNKSNTVKICDFGSSKYIDEGGKNTPYIVSRYYRAPELILCITNYGSPIDIWATGCILAELITRDPIFQGKSEGDQLFAIFNMIGSPSEAEYTQFSRRVPFDPKLFNDFPVVNRSKEDFGRQFVNFSDHENLLDLLYKTFQYLPEKRITATEAIQHPFFDEIRSDYEDLIQRIHRRKS